jgi:aspartate aminotransferase
VSYADIALVSNAKPVIVECGIEQKFKMTALQLEKAITPKTKLLMLNSPSNPTGAVYSKEELESLAKILIKHPNILIGTDDMYEHVKLKDMPFYNILNVEPSLKDRCVVMNGVSKAYSMTGWRIGFAAGPSYIIKAMEIIQSQSTSNPTSISQVAAEAALSGDQACMQPMIKAFRERHDFVVKSFNEIPGLSCIEAEGAFYAFPDARKAIENLYNKKILKEKNDLALADYLLEKEGVAVVPGSAFGAEGYFRISFATSMKNLIEALTRIKRALSV